MLPLTRTPRRSRSVDGGERRERRPGLEPRLQAGRLLVRHEVISEVDAVPAGRLGELRRPADVRPGLLGPDPEHEAHRRRADSGRAGRRREQPADAGRAGRVERPAVPEDLGEGDGRRPAWSVDGEHLPVASRAALERLRPSVHTTPPVASRAMLSGAASATQRTHSPGRSERGEPRQPIAAHACHDAVSDGRPQLPAGNGEGLRVGAARQWHARDETAGPTVDHLDDRSCGRRHGGGGEEADGVVVAGGVSRLHAGRPTGRSRRAAEGREWTDRERGETSRSPPLYSCRPPRARCRTPARAHARR